MKKLFSLKIIKSTKEFINKTGGGGMKIIYKPTLCEKIKILFCKTFTITIYLDTDCPDGMDRAKAKLETSEVAE